MRDRIKPDKTGLLRGIKEITAYLDFSERMFKIWVSRGMPVLYDGGSYYAHKSNLEDFFIRETKRRYKAPPGE